ncbi:MAG: hypothetical protein ACLQD8_06965 [Thermoplasmata archaeon]
MTATSVAPGLAPETEPRLPPVRERGVSRHESLQTEDWSARGAAKVIHDADVGTADLQGSVSVGGSFRAGRLRWEGRLEVGGALEVREALSARGELRGGSTLRAGDVTLRGRLRLAGAATVDRRIDVTGRMRAASLAAAEFRADGVVEIPGTIRAIGVDLRLRDGSRIGPVEGGTVRIVTHVPNLIDKVLGRTSRVSVARIEADRVELEGVEVAFVRAREITLGPGCQVTALEGTVVRRHPTSRLGPESRSLPPYGLRR